MRNLPLLVACAFLLPTAAAERVTVPGAEQVLAALASTNWEEKRLAEGHLYLLPASDFPVLIARIERRRDQHDKELHPIVRALVLRGHPPAVEGFIDARTPGGPPASAYSVEDEYLLRQATPDEVAPLAKGFAERLMKKKLDPSYQATDLWVRLAGMSGEPTMMKTVLAFLGTDQGRMSAARNMVGRFNPDRCSDALIPGLQHKDLPVRTFYAQLLASGWHEGPTPRVAASFKDPEASVRRIFANTLSRSSSAAALDLMLQGLDDEDPSVRSSCLSALGNYSGPPQTILLRKLATNERLDVSMRRQAWWMLAYAPGDDLLAEAKALVSRSEADMSLRNTAVTYLMRRDQGRWLLDAVSRVEPRMKAEILADLARSGSTAVFEELPAFLRRADASLAGMVLSSLGSLKDPRLLPLLIGNLKDVRPEVRRSATQALSTATGRNYQPPAPERGEGERSDADEARLLHAAWSRWYELFAAPPAPAMEQDLALVRGVLAERTRSEAGTSSFVGLNGDLWSVLLRMTEDRQVADKAFAELVCLGDKRTAGTLLDLIEGPYFSEHRNAIRDALMANRSDAELTPRVLKLLSRSGTEDLAIDILVAWRVGSPTLTDAILRKGYLSERLVKELSAWKDCPVLSAARKLVTDDKVEDGRRSQALALLVQIGDERDVRALAKEVSEVGPNAHSATRGLVRMATSGVESAAREVARILNQAPRKPPLRKPTRPLQQGKPVEEPPPSKPDPSPGLISALRDRPTTGKEERLPLPEIILEAVRSWTREAQVPEHQLAGLVLLIEANDLSGVEVLRGILSDGKPPQIKQAVSTVLATRKRQAQPYVDLLLTHAVLDDETIRRVGSWYYDIVKLPAAEVAEIRKKLTARQDADAGKPARDVIISIDLDGTTAPLGAKGLKAKVQIKNVGKKPYTFIPEWLEFNMRIKRMGDEDGEINRSLRLDFKSKMTPASGPQPTVLAPGQSLTSTLTYEAPDDYFTSAAHRIRFRCGVMRSLGTPEDEESGTFNTPWINFTFIPPLWDAIDKRTSAGR